jgi:hypothetical protein
LCKNISNSKWFDNFILITISISSVTLVFENPLNDPEGVTFAILQTLEYISSAIFLLEVLIKVVAMGFYFNGPDSYARKGANVLDFLIVFMSIISLFPQGYNLSHLKIIRMIRLLRPLRVISKNEGLRISVKALVVSVPGISSLMVIFFFVMFILAIVGVNLLKGKSFYCDLSGVYSISEIEIEMLIKNKYDCLNYGGSWRRKYYNFDNIRDSML